ncbi:MAG: c-type cytochrome [Gammaproteobacteria bacterium]|nr:c-type cytochrome [Gammaproteobacteria bacterium]
MIRFLVAVAAGAMLTACGSGDQGTAPEAAADMAAFDIAQAESPSGKQVYDEVCSGCHAEGLDGAPKMGDPESWAGRSQLWTSVLFEHAITGYRDMPAKGGIESLDEAAVTRAAEYMLRATFPDIPPD